jgi:RecJ-like exonuclease
MDLIKITQDKERAQSILRMVSLIEERIEKEDREKMAALIIVDYYEIMKELITAILLIDGYKTLSHKDLIEYLAENYLEFNSRDISILNNLRILRNRVSYEGFFIEPSYLKRNERSFKKIIQKLKNLVKKKLE